MNIVLRIVAVAAMLGTSAMSASAERLASATDAVAFDISAKKKKLRDGTKYYDKIVEDNKVTEDEYRNIGRSRSSPTRAGRTVDLGREEKMRVRARRNVAGPVHVQ
jgi:hypothetical protein